MADDGMTERDDDSGMVAAEAWRDERWAGGLSGGAARVGVVAGTGVLLLLAAVSGIRGALGSTVLAPWAGVALYGLAVVVATGGMVIAARVAGGRTARRSIMGADRAGVTAAAGHAAADTTTGDTASHGVPLERFQLETRAGRRVVAASSVEWFEASGNYARLHLPGESFLYRMPLSQLEQVLDARQFVRVHRSAIINLDAVRRIETMPSGDAALSLASGAQVRMSRRYAAAFHARTGRGY